MTHLMLVLPAEYYSMSTEDLRMPREALRKSSMAPALSTPALNDDEVFDSDQGKRNRLGL